MMQLFGRFLQYILAAVGIGDFLTVQEAYKAALMGPLVLTWRSSSDPCYAALATMQLRMWYERGRVAGTEIECERIKLTAPIFAGSISAAFYDGDLLELRIPNARVTVETLPEPQARLLREMLRWAQAAVARSEEKK